MTVFIAHTEADIDAADALAKAIERRGLFVEHEGGEHVGRDLQANDALVLLWSEDAALDANRLVMERRALDAWAEDKLVLVTLDRAEPPVGLRDLPIVAAPAVDQGPAAWEATLGAIGNALAPPAAPEAARRSAAPSPAPSSAPVGFRAPQAGASGLGGLFILIGVLALIALGVWVYQRLQFRVLDLPDVPGWTLWAVAGGVIALFAIVRLFAPRGRRKKRKARPAPQAVAAPVEPAGAALFVSYAHNDALAVAPVVAAVERAGRPVWIDKSGLAGGQSWAGEIVRAIKGARGVMVLCSPAAFASDHVKREVYLADRYRKPLLPVFLSPAEMPEDFEYFFAGVQWLDLHRLPEGERPAAIKRALAAV